MSRLKELRKEKKLNQTEVANIFKISQNAYSNWELNAKAISAPNVIKLAKYFNVTTDYLLGASDIKNAASLEDCKKLKNATMAQKEAFDALLELDTLQIGRVLSYIDGLKTMKHHF